MPLIQPGQKFWVCINCKSSYLVPGEILTIQTIASDNTVEFLCSERSRHRCLSTSLLKHWIATKEIVLIEEPAKPRIQMEKPMSEVRIVDVFLFDDTPGLKAEDRLIAKYEGITTDGSDTDVIVELALNHNIKEQLANHNEKRAKTVNEDLLNRVGKKVMLLPLEAKQIEYRIKPVVQL